MSILAFGINHVTAPVQLRERVAFAPERTVAALQELGQRPGVTEAAILSTCNRTEIYCSLEQESNDVPGTWLHRYHQLDPGKLDPFVYNLWDDQAVRHMLRVATGLDSMVLGEPEILGQMKAAYRFALTASTLSHPLSRLFQHTFAVAKQIRTDTEIGRNPVSVAYAAVSLARQLFGDLSRQTVLLIGAGETMELTARHLLEQRVAHLIVANRTLARAQEMANRFRGVAIPLIELRHYLPRADLILSSTAASEPILPLELVEEAIRARKRRPMFMVDLAVPRDIEATVARLEDVYLYTIDDLHEVADSGRDQRRRAADKAETMIDLQVDRYMDWLRSLGAVVSIREYRGAADQVRRELLARAQVEIAAGKPALEVVERLAHSLTQRLLHHPSIRMREAAGQGRSDLIRAARELFDLPEMED